MPSGHNIGLFAAAALVLLAIPGPAVLYVVTQSVQHGRRAGLAAVAGIHAGTSVHVVAAALGLSAILVSSATAFTVVKYAGAAYLVYLGIQRLRSRATLELGAAPEPAPLGRVVRRGFLVNLLNPKTALFFFAFLPQFVEPGRGAVALQIATLGLVFLLLGLVTDSVWALAAGSAAGWLRRRPAVVRVERWLSGALFIGLGVATALTSSERRS